MTNTINSFGQRFGATIGAFILMPFFLVACSQSEEPSVNESTATEAKATAPTNTDSRPNILLITADDMGYTDLGSFGGEIRTPNLDALASSGVRLTNFHVGPACSQTRTMLMSGTYTEVGGTPGRGRVLADDVVALPQYMADAGYHTYLSGKWHLGSEPDQHPMSRGFESSFALIPGSGEHFHFGSNATDATKYMENGEFVDFPEDAYSTELYTDKMLGFLKEHEGDGKPFFAWYTPTSPHWPIQVPDDHMHLYEGVYDSGYEALLQQRIQQAEQKGVLPEGFSLENYPRTGQPWESMTEEEQKYEARIMELYAAMVENLDYHTGRIVDYLKDTGQYDNTLIIFSSDNGSDPRGGTDREDLDNSYENLGRANSYAAISGWADAHTAPFKNEKGTQSEGGTRVPAIISYPSLGNQGGVDNRFITIMDFKPTFIELAGLEPAGTTYDGRSILPNAGDSFAAMIQGNEVENLFENRTIWYSQAFYKDNWKLSQPRGSTEWQLFDIQNDPSETNNLANDRSDILQSLLAEWARIGTEAGYQIPVGNGGNNGGMGMGNN